MTIFKRRTPDLDAPRALRSSRDLAESRDSGRNERFGRWTESIARGMGTPWFLLILTLFCVLWLVWNTVGPMEWRFDSAALGFTALTLILSLQASYAAPMILLAQNRQDDRDKVQAEQDRQSNERNHATTDFITREIASLRLALNDVATRDFVRGELRDLLREVEEEKDEETLRTIVREELAAALGRGDDPRKETLTTP